MRMGMESDDEISAESVEGGWRLRRGRVCLDQSSSVWYGIVWYSMVDDDDDETGMEVKIRVRVGAGVS